EDGDLNPVDLGRLTQFKLDDSGEAQLRHGTMQVPMRETPDEYGSVGWVLSKRLRIKVIRVQVADIDPVGAEGCVSLEQVIGHRRIVEPAAIVRTAADPRVGDENAAVAERQHEARIRNELGPHVRRLAYAMRSLPTPALAQPRRNSVSLSSLDRASISSNATAARWQLRP